MDILKKPVINYFKVSAHDVMDGDEVSLTWEVQGSKKVRLDGIEQEASGAYHAIISTDRSFVLTASSTAGRTEEIVTINLLRPQVLRFDTDAAVVRENIPIIASFQLKHTRLWKLNAEYGYGADSRTETVARGQVEDGKAESAHTVPVNLTGACILKLITNNGSALGRPVEIRLGARVLTAELMPETFITRKGATVRIGWDVQNANKQILNPGNLDVTGLTHHDLIIAGDRDVELELIAYGDFGKKITCSKTLRLAKINRFNTSNNEHADKPEFYLNWSATGLDAMRLLPDNIPVNESVSKHGISGGTIPLLYTLTGRIYTGEEVTGSLTAFPCTIKSFALEKPEVIVGTTTSLHWSVEHATLIQLKFSDEHGVIKLLPTDTAYHFQVRKTITAVKLIVWGDINVIEMEIPVKPYVCPEIRQLHLPAVSLRVGVVWLPGPASQVQRGSGNTNQPLLRTAVSTHALYNRMLQYISMPSYWLLRRKNRQINNTSVQHSSHLVRILNTVGKKIIKMCRHISEKLKIKHNESKPSTHL